MGWLARPWRAAGGKRESGRVSHRQSGVLYTDEEQSLVDGPSKVEAWLLTVSRITCAHAAQDRGGQGHGEDGAAHQVH